MKKVKLELTNQQIITKYECLSAMKSYANSDLTLAKKRTINFLEIEYKPLAQTRQEIFDAAKEYNEELHKGLIELCKKDEHDNPKCLETDNNTRLYDIAPENIKAKDKLFNELKEKHKDALDKQKKMQDDFDALLKKTTEVFICQIPYTAQISQIGIGDDGKEADILFYFNDEENTSSAT